MDGRLQRLFVGIGAEVDSRFDPERIGLEARLPDDPDRCEVTLEELVTALVGGLPRAKTGTAP